MKNKTWIVFKSEYLRRVQSKKFILTTLLVPVGIILFYVGIIAVVVFSFAQDEAAQLNIAIVDETPFVLDTLLTQEHEAFALERSTAPIDTLREAVAEGTYDGYVVLPATLISGTADLTLYTSDVVGSSVRGDLRGAIRSVIEAERMREMNISPEVMDALETDIALRSVKLSESGEEVGSTETYTIIGMVVGVLIFFSIFLYGSVVMQGVMEEKTTRVVEVVVSSVKPFQLMLGKLLGIAGMGLTQLGIWFGVVFGLQFVGGIVLGQFFGGPSEADQAQLDQAMRELPFDFALPAIGPEVFIWFVFFFLFGYLLYASLFAAIGSAVEQQQDAQSFMLPIMVPIFIAYGMLFPVAENPNTALAIGASLVPFFSPILMTVRVAISDVPFWQVGLSALLLVATFLGTTWVGSRIYRVGILMHGKKPSFGELLKWMRYS